MSGRDEPSTTVSSAPSTFTAAAVKVVPRSIPRPYSTTPQMLEVPAEREKPSKLSARRPNTSPSGQPAGADQAGLVGVDDQLGAVAGAQLDDRAAHVGLRGGGADH